VLAHFTQLMASLGTPSRHQGFSGRPLHRVGHFPAMCNCWYQGIDCEDRHFRAMERQREGPILMASAFHNRCTPLLKTLQGCNLAAYLLSTDNTTSSILVAYTTRRTSREQVPYLCMLMLLLPRPPPLLLLLPRSCALAFVIRLLMGCFTP